MRIVVALHSLLCASGVQVQQVQQGGLREQDADAGFPFRWNPFGKKTSELASKTSFPSGEVADEESNDTPHIPGCYKRFPSGCWRYPNSNRVSEWQHDVVAEEGGSALGEASCKKRKIVWDQYCNVKDAQVVFVPGRLGGDERASLSVPTVSNTLPLAPELVEDEGWDHQGMWTSTRSASSADSPATPAAEAEDDPSGGRLPDEAAPASAAPAAAEVLNSRENASTWASLNEDHEFEAEFEFEKKTPKKASFEAAAVEKKKAAFDFESADKEAAEEYEEEKRTHAEAEALKELEWKRREDAVKAAQGAQGIALAKKGTADKAYRKALEVTAQVEVDSEEEVEGRTRLARAEAAAAKAAASELDATTVLEGLKDDVKAVEERMDAVEANGVEPDANLRMQLSDVKGAVRKAGASVVEMTSVRIGYEQSVEDAKKAVKAAESRISEGHTAKQLADTQLLRAAKDFQVAQREKDQTALEKEAQDLAAAEEAIEAQRAARHRKAAAERALADAQDARKLVEAEAAEKEAFEAAAAAASLEAEERRERREAEAEQREQGEAKAQEEAAAMQAAEEAARKQEEARLFLEKEAARKQEEKAELEVAKEEPGAGGGAAAGAAAPPAEVAALPAKAEQDEARPTEPGCYMKMPTGCQSRTSRTQKWRRDKWAEGHGLDSTGCAGRRVVWNEYCQREDVEVVFIESQTSWGSSPDSSLGVGESSQSSSDPLSTLQLPPLPSLPPQLPPLPSLPPLPLSTLQLEAKEAWPWSRKRDKAEEAEAQTKVDAEAKAEVGAESDSEVDNPDDPGCYMRMPSGCPKNPMQTDLWRHDSWAEHHEIDEHGCKARKDVWDKYCETGDAKMVFVHKVGNVTLEEPARPVNLFSASPSWPWSRKREKAEEAEAQTKVDAEAKAEVGAESDSEIAYPDDPGCYMMMPSGCPKNPMKTDLWRHDAWAEHHELDEHGCKGRTSVWDKYCETGDAKMVFVRNVGNVTLVEPARPVKLFSASPVQFLALSSWPWSANRAKVEPEAKPKAETEEELLHRHLAEATAEADAEAKAGAEAVALAKERAEAEAEAAKTMAAALAKAEAQEAKAQEAKAKAHAKAQAKAEEAEAEALARFGTPADPGCYMMVPSGCPKNPMQKDSWSHDAWAEHHRLDHEGCLDRKQVWNTYCGSDGAMMAFVGNPTSPQ